MSLLPVASDSSFSSTVMESCASSVGSSICSSGARLLERDEEDMAGGGHYSMAGGARTGTETF